MENAQYADVGGIRTRYFEAGSGPTIVLVHGGGFDYRLGICADDWLPVFNILSESHHVVALDRLGSGLTDSPAAPDQYTAQALHEHLERFIEVVGLSGVYIVGHSSGALPATLVALTNPDVRGLTVVGSATLAPSAGGPRHIAYVPAHIAVPDEDAVADIMSSSFREPDGEPAREYVQRKVRNCFASEFIHDDRRFIAEHIERVVALERTTYTESAYELKHRVLEGIRAGKLTLPTLVVWGGLDQSAPLSAGLDLYNLMLRANPNTDLAVIGDADHMPHVEKAETFARLLADFVRRGQLAVCS